MSLNDFLKMSLVPVPCQECLLNANGRTISESIEWLMDLKDKIPIWSRLNEINTCGFKRKLPMSMTKNYDIEIKGRLWSLWGHKRKHKETRCKSLNCNKSYMAITVLALCSARAIRLNIWNSNLMDCIWNNGRQFYKQSLRNFKGPTKEFQLENLDLQCTLEGIKFKILLTTTQQGSLYSKPLKCQLNLACALKQFFSSYQFGILECNQRMLGFGFINVPDGGYFMFDAQSSNYPLFPKNITAPYLLRTNHLQVLLYCLIVSLNNSFMYSSFCLHHVEIEIVKPEIPQTNKIPCMSSMPKCKRLIPDKYWKVPSIMSLKPQSSKSSLFDKLEKCLVYINKCDAKKKKQPKYRRKIHNITKDEVERSLIKPLVDADRQSDEDLKINKDFVRMICSDTIVPILPEEEEAGRFEKDFVHDLLDALVMGGETCKRINKIQNC